MVDPMNPNAIVGVALCVAAPVLVWALAWWDVARRKVAEDNAFVTLRNQLATVQVAQSDHARTYSEISRHAKTVAENVHKRLESAEALLEQLQRNPASMSATKERVDVIEAAMKHLTEQVKAELTEMKSSQAVMLQRVNRTPYARPNG